MDLVGKHIRREAAKLILAKTNLRTKQRGSKAFPPGFWRRGCYTTIIHIATEYIALKSLQGVWSSLV